MRSAQSPPASVRRVPGGTEGLRCLCIIPTYNERENLPRLVPDLLGRVSGLEVLVVDDGSPDGTASVAGELAVATGRVQVLRRAGKMGLGSAYVTGFRYALEHGYDYVIQMDADLSHRPKDLPRLLETAREGAGVVIGSRYVPGGRVEDWSIVRRLVSKGGSFYAPTCSACRSAIAPADSNASDGRRLSLHTSPTWSRTATAFRWR